MRLLPLFALALFGCAPTSTDNGSIGEDEDEGLDPAADEDNDGVTNADEEEMGLDPYEADSDEDGYADGAEIEAGTNPLYVWSHTFDEGDYLVGNCPVLPNTDNAGPTKRKKFYQKGDIMENIVVGGHDSFGQEVTLYSFCGNYVLITVSAEWCGPCQSMASTMARESRKVHDEVPNFTFFEYLYQDNYGETSSVEVLANWAADYKLDGIPVVAAEDQNDDVSLAETTALVQGGGIPSTTLVAPDMTVAWTSVENPEQYYLSGDEAILEAIAAYEAELAGGGE